MSLLGTYWTPQNLHDMQVALKARLDATATAVQACGATLDAATVAGWNAFYAGIEDFTGEDPSFWGAGAMADQGQAHDAELTAWQRRMGPKCPGVAALIPVDDGSDKTSDLVKIFKYGAIIAVFVGSAYVVSSVASTVKLFGPGKSA